MDAAGGGGQRFRGRQVGPWDAGGSAAGVSPHPLLGVAPQPSPLEDRRMPVVSLSARSLHCCVWTLALALALAVAAAHATAFAAEPADAGLVGEYFANGADYPPAESK